MSHTQQHFNCRGNQKRQEKPITEAFLTRLRRRSFNLFSLSACLAAKSTFLDSSTPPATSSWRSSTSSVSGEDSRSLKEAAMLNCHVIKFTISRAGCCFYSNTHEEAAIEHELYCPRDCLRLCRTRTLSLSDSCKRLACPSMERGILDSHSNSTVVVVVCEKGGYYV